MFLHHPRSLDKLLLLVLGFITAGTLTLTACSPATDHHDFSATKKIASSSTPSVTAKDSPSPASPPTSPSTPDPEPKKTLAGKTIVIDPGHSNGQHLTNKVPDGRGGSKICNTSGTATNNGYPEHTANWKVALILQTELQEKGASVYLTKKMTMRIRYVSIGADKSRTRNTPMRSYLFTPMVPNHQPLTGSS